MIAASTWILIAGLAMPAVSPSGSAVPTTDERVAQAATEKKADEPAKPPETTETKDDKEGKGKTDRDKKRDEKKDEAAEKPAATDSNQKAVGGDRGEF
jgi:hypothetical protein